MEHARSELTEENVGILIPAPWLLKEFTLAALDHSKRTNLHKRAIEGRTAGALKGGEANSIDVRRVDEQ